MRASRQIGYINLSAFTVSKPRLTHYVIKLNYPKTLGTWLNAKQFYRHAFTLQRNKT
jgi:hypothetical protein